MRKIVASPTHSPLPSRSHDWCAYFEGEEEAGGYGYGATEEEAIADFVENVAENSLDELVAFWKADAQRQTVLLRKAEKLNAELLALLIEIDKRVIFDASTGFDRAFNERVEAVIAKATGEAT